MWILLLLLVSCQNRFNPPKEKKFLPRSEVRIQKFQTSFGVWNKNSLPIPLKISTEFSGNEQQEIIKMVNTWDDAVETKLFNNSVDLVSPPFLDQPQNYRDDVIGIYKIDHWFDWPDPTALAITQFFGRKYRYQDGSTYIELNHADIFINDRYFDFSVDNQAGEFDLRTVVLHELGHLLGLSHNIEDKSIMVPSILPETSIKQIGKRDQHAIKGLYDKGMAQDSRAKEDMGSVTGYRILRPSSF